MPDLYQIIERPVITEKALAENGQRRYVFIVNKDANKIQIREAIEKLFTTPDGEALKVTDVNTIVVKGRMKRYRAFGRFNVAKSPSYKKAVVTLAEGQSIQIFEGV